MTMPVPETVVILHGIGKSCRSMVSVERVLTQNGYSVLNITYPSRRYDLDVLVGFLRQTYLTSEFWEKAGTVHFVAHSMGGLLVRRYLHHDRVNIPPEKMGRVVMLGTPNGGSEVADRLHKFLLYRLYYGPAGQDLTVASCAKMDIPVGYQIGVIAGTKNWPYVVSRLMIAGQNDGRVAVERTKVKGMTAHATVYAAHAVLMDAPKVHAHILSFLRTGRFIK